MPVQFPTLSTQEQTDRVTSIAKNTLFPYSYSTTLVIGAGDFPNSDASSTFKYNTIAFQADNNLAISAFQLSYLLNPIFQVGSATQTSFLACFVLTYSPLLKFNTTADPGAAFAIPTPVGNTGNDIFRFQASVINPSAVAGSASQQSNSIFERFEPYNYLLKFNQILYLHIGIDTNSQAGNVLGQVFPSIILHTLPTGQKS